MTFPSWFALLTLLIPAVVFLLLPYMTPRRYFFGITVAPDFFDSAPGRAIRRGYMIAVGVGVAIAIGLAYVIPPAAPAFAIAAPAIAGMIGFYHARHLAAQHATVVSPIREADLSPAPDRLPLWGLLALPPIAALAAAWFYLRAHWDEIPARFPVHWDWNGQPNGWANKTPMGVFGDLYIGGAGLLFIALLGIGMVYGARRTPFRTGVLKILLGTMYMMAYVIVAVALLPLHRIGPAGLMVPIVVSVVAILAYSFKLAVDPDSGTDPTPDSCWYWSQIYYNPADPAIFVQRRVGIGYTLNLGNRLSWIVMGVPLVTLAALLLVLR